MKIDCRRSISRNRESIGLPSYGCFIRRHFLSTVEFSRIVEHYFRSIIWLRTKIGSLRMIFGNRHSLWSKDSWDIGQPITTVEHGNLSLLLTARCRWLTRIIISCAECRCLGLLQPVTEKKEEKVLDPSRVVYFEYCLFINYYSIMPILST